MQALACMLVGVDLFEFMIRCFTGYYEGFLTDFKGLGVCRRFLGFGVSGVL